MSDQAPANRRRGGARRPVEAPLDPLFEGGDESPAPGPATTTVRPPGSASPARPKSAIVRGLSLVAGVMVVLAASCLVAWGARRYVMTSPRFAIRTVLVDGGHKRSAAQIASAGGVEVGKNIFALDLGGASAMILQDPWIEKAKVERKLPSTISVTVIEREARAAAAIGGDLYLVTRDGEPFKKVGGDDPTDLPIVTGITTDQVAKDRAGVILAYKRALDVADEMERVGLAKRWPIQELHLEKDGSLVVTIGKEAIALAFGMPPYRDKIAQAVTILNELVRRKADASVIFLDNQAHPERVVVRMR